MGKSLRELTANRELYRVRNDINLFVVTNKNGVSKGLLLCTHCAYSRAIKDQYETVKHIPTVIPHKCCSNCGVVNVPYLAAVVNKSVSSVWYSLENAKQPYLVWGKRVIDITLLRMRDGTPYKGRYKSADYQKIV